MNEGPFEENLDTKFFFESDEHREALDRMLYIVNDKNMNMGLLTGEIGSGKSLTRKVFLSTLSSKKFCPIFFENSNFPFTDLLYDIIINITFNDPRLDMHFQDESPVRGDKYLLMNIFKSKLKRLVYEENRKLILVFDESQQMSEDVMDEIKNLTNISSDVENYMSVFFVGQPELREKVRLLKQIDQRIFLRFHINNLDYNNTSKYIHHRLRVAGIVRNNIFTDDSIESIYRNTAGVPREINRLCKLALTNGFATELSEITADDIAVITEDLDLHR